MKKSFLKNLLSHLLVIALIIASCSLPIVQSTSLEAQAATIKINVTKKSIYAGKTTVLSLKGTTKTPKWSSSDKSIATVSSKGKVKGKKPGTATITAKLSGKSYKCKVTVKSALSVSKTSVSITPEKTAKVKVTFKLAGNLYYECSDTSVISCKWDSAWSGNTIKLTITPKNTGTATIKITNNKNSEYKKIKVTVNAGAEVYLDEDLPQTLDNYGLEDSVTQSYSLTTIKYSAAYSTSQKNYDITLYFAGKKLSDAEGDAYSRAVNISWKLYDSDNAVVASGTATTPAVAAGEAFKNTKAYIYDLKAGEYTLKIISTD